ncbi:MAG: site-2 protease family protein [Defluviitaleaceae bacterium]|nr:site-2 protease family protein [Defluviitaleaceae bacterium]
MIDGINTNVQAHLMILPIMIFVFAIHELAHAVTALWLGDRTAKNQGRITLNPLKHIDWIGLFVFVAMGIGWAKPVPVVSQFLKYGKLGFALTALAGPLSNIILGLVLSVITGFVFLIGGWGNIIGMYLLRATEITFFLAFFNLIPIPPFDGSKIIAPLVPDEYYDSLITGGWWSMLLLGVLLLTGVHRIVTDPIMELLFTWVILPIVFGIAFLGGF